MTLANFTNLAVLAVTVLLAGCAGGPAVNMSPTDKATIKSVTMSTTPALPAEMFFQGRAESFAMVGGVVGATLAGSVAKEPKAQLLDTMKANNIDLPSILKTEFFGAAKARGLLAQAESPASAQGDLTLTVNIYGFAQTQGFSALLYPLLNVTATIRKPTGEIAWQETAYVTPHNSDNKFGYEFGQYIRDPELMRKTLTNVAGVVSTMLLSPLSD